MDFSSLGYNSSYIRKTHLRDQGRQCMDACLEKILSKVWNKGDNACVPSRCSCLIKILSKVQKQETWSDEYQQGNEIHNKVPSYTEFNPDLIKDNHADHRQLIWLQRTTYDKDLFDSRKTQNLKRQDSFFYLKRLYSRQTALLLQRLCSIVSNKEIMFKHLLLFGVLKVMQFFNFTQKFNS